MKFLEAMKRTDQAVAALRSGATNDPDYSGYFRAHGKNLNPAAVLEMRRFMEGIKTGRLDPLEIRLRLREAQTTSDFPYLMGDTLYRELLAQYTMAPASWPSIAYRRVVNDFRTNKSITIDGGTAAWRPVAEQAPYKQILFADGQYTVQVYKFGEKAGFSWETTINDDLDALSRVPMLMGQGARTMEEYNFTNLYAGNATFFAAGNKNLITTTYGAATNNPLLTPGGIADGMTVMRKQLNSDGSPIMINAFVLVVPTALEETANRILNADSIWWNDVGGTSNQRLLVKNTLPSKIKMVVAPWLDVIDASGHGKTGWYLFADPNVGRPAVQVALLRGHEQPELFQKAPDQMRVGGGMADVMEGSFDNDMIEYKGRHVFGVGLVDPKMAAYSNGTGS